MIIIYYEIFFYACEKKFSIKSSIFSITTVAGRFQKVICQCLLMRLSEVHYEVPNRVLFKLKQLNNISYILRQLQHASYQSKQQQIITNKSTFCQRQVFLLHISQQKNALVISERYFLSSLNRL